jgi:REP element-mobilizing transposase RayT
MERYRIAPDGSIYYVTFSVVQWLPVFVSEASCRIVTDSLRFCRERKGLCSNAYVIMPTHLHAIVFHESGNAEELEGAVTDLRKFTGRQLCDFCAAHLPACFSDVFRQSAGADRSRQFWQATRHPEVLETERFWRQKLDYLHENPCRKGLVRRAQDWRFSSAAFWLSDGQAESDVLLTAIDWA